MACVGGEGEKCNPKQEVECSPLCNLLRVAVYQGYTKSLVGQGTKGMLSGQ